MITKEQLQTLLEFGLSGGADYSEIFLEDTLNQNIRVMSGQVSDINNSNVYGVGIRLLKEDKEVYAYTNNVNYDVIYNLINDLKDSFVSDNLTQAVKLGQPKQLSAKILKPHNSISLDEKTNKLVELSNIMSNHDERIVQSITQLVQTTQNVLVVNSEGVYQNDERVYTRLVLAAVASENGQMQQAFEGPGRFMGLELFDHIDANEYALDVAKSAILLLTAEDIESQNMTVVLHNGFGGVIFHEALGHPLEASSIAKGLSPFVGKIGEKVGSELVTAYDDGNSENAWGRVSFDDEGTPSQKNLLIENGILKSYLVDKKNGRTLNMPSTGSSRRQSYKYAPTSRMNSTYIANGSDKFEDIIKDTKYGLFAKKLGGGTVQPATGEFNFAVQEGYLIEDGKLTKAVKGAMLIGHGKDILFKIDRVADNLEFGQGMCGASSGSIPVDVGQPTIRVTDITVGGLGGKK